MCENNVLKYKMNHELEVYETMWDKGTKELFNSQNEISRNYSH